MTESTAKIRIKMGRMEIEYEGAADFLTSGLIKLMEAAGNLQMPALNEASEEDSANGSNSQSAKAVVANQASTSTIATRLKVKSGPDLALAASAHLAIVQNKDKFSRKEILAHMQGATAFYKSNMSSNLSQILNGLVKSGKINDVGTDMFALSDAERANVEAVLAKQS